MRVTDQYLTRLACRTWPSARVEIEEPPRNKAFAGHERAYYLTVQPYVPADESTRWVRVLGFTFRNAKDTLQTLRQNAK